MASILNLHPLTPESVPDPQSEEFKKFVDSYFEAGVKLVDSMDSWNHNSKKNHNTVDIVDLPSSSQARKALGIKEYWCARISHHTPETVAAHAQPEAPQGISRMWSHRPAEVEHKAKAVEIPHDLYERFRGGLLEYHSHNEREYIEACRESECLEVYQPQLAEVWRLTYVTPPPTNPRTFVVLLLCRELNNTDGSRCFMNISIPFSHPKCPEKQGNEKSRTRGKYVSVERVREVDNGAQVEWRMGTASDAGGNIPRFITNSSLPSSIAIDVPSFLKWLSKKWINGEETENPPVDAPAITA